jgi:hypothetical protein
MGPVLFSATRLEVPSLRVSAEFIQQCAAPKVEAHISPFIRMMKFVLTLAAFTAGFAMQAEASLLGSWNHDEASGPLIDSTGNHPPGLPGGAGTPVYGRPGVPNGTYGAITITDASGTAIEYGPSTEDDFFVVGLDNNNPVMNLDNTAAFTVMGWMNPFAPTAARSYKFLSTGSAAGGDRGWGFALRLNNTAGTGSAVRFTGFGIADNDSSLIDVTFNTWIHMAATYNNGAITYFVNGNMLDTDTSVFGNDLAAARLTVGSRLGGNDADQMNGLLDGVRVYNTVLTVDEIRQAAVESVSQIPEPSSLVLALLVGSGLALRPRRQSWS